MLRLSFAGSQYFISIQIINNLQNSVSVRTYYIDIELLLLFSLLRIQPIFAQREQADRRLTSERRGQFVLVFCAGHLAVTLGSR